MRSIAARLLLCLLAIVPAAAHATVTASVAGGVLTVFLSGSPEHAFIYQSGADIGVSDVGGDVILTTPSAGVDRLEVGGDLAPPSFQSVQLSGTLAFPGGVYIDTVTYNVIQANVTTSTYFANVTMTVSALGGSSIDATGYISLYGNVAGVSFTNNPGVELIGTQVISSSGVITIRGRGGPGAGLNPGVDINGGSKVRTTGPGGNYISIDGTGGSGTGTFPGVYIRDAGTEVTTVDAPIFLTGFGRPSNGTDNPGIHIAAGALVSSTGTGDITLDGTGATAGASLYGVWLRGPGTLGGNGVGQVKITGVGGLGQAGIVTDGGFNVNGNVTYLADVMNLSGNTGGGSVTIRPLTPAMPMVITAGSPAGALFIHPAWLANITAAPLYIGVPALTGGLEVGSALVAPAGWSSIALQNAGPIFGAGSITAGALTVVDGSSTGHTWTLDGTHVKQDANPSFGFNTAAMTLYSGSGSDTFTVTPSVNAVQNILGGLPDPAALPGDRLVITGTAANISATPSATGFSGIWVPTSGHIVTFAGMESAPFNRIGITAPASAMVGTPFNVTVSALDTFGQVDTTYVGTMHFTSSDGAAALPADVALVGGTATVSVTLATLGNQTVTATDTVTAANTATSSAIAVGVGAATHFVVTAPATVDVGTPASFSVTAYDAGNNVVTGYAGTVHFTSSDATATLPADATLTAGTGTFSATFNSNGSFTITATDTVTPAITGTSGTVTTSLKSFSAPSATGSGVITASFTGGGVTCSFTAPQMIGAPPGAFPVPPTKPAPNAEFPHGMFDFQLTGCTVGSTVTMSIAYPSRPGTLWKYGPEIGTPVAHWYKMPATISGNTVTYTMTDGGVGDDDLAANGTFVDPVGPAFVPDHPIPTLSQWMLMLLALMVLGAGMRRRLP